LENSSLAAAMQELSAPEKGENTTSSSMPQVPALESVDTEELELFKDVDLQSPPLKKQHFEDSAEAVANQMKHQIKRGRGRGRKKY
jgi:hypothetical protein